MVCIGMAALKIKNVNDFAFRIDDPILPDSGKRILSELIHVIIGSRGRRNNFDDQIRGTVAALSVSSFCRITDYADVRLKVIVIVLKTVRIDGKGRNKNFL